MLINAMLPVDFPQKTSQVPHDVSVGSARFKSPIMRLDVFLDEDIPEFPFAKAKKRGRGGQNSILGRKSVHKKMAS
jgi:hypothetical protein